MEEIGLSGERAENPGRNAYIWVPVGDGAFYVGAYALEDDSSDFAVTGERVIEGLTIELGHHVGDNRAFERFSCDGIRYYLNGDLPPGFDDMSTLVDQFAQAIGCL